MSNTHGVGASDRRRTAETISEPTNSEAGRPHYRLSERPNIVFITSDTQGREMLSPYVDRPGVDTPELQRMADEGVVFDNVVVAAPTCTPSRGSWYTGLHPNRHGAICNELGLSRAVPTLAELLQADGYRTHHIGKWHLDAAGYTGAGRAEGGFAPETWYDLRNFYEEVGTQGPNKFGGWNRGLHDIEYCFGHRVADRAIRFLEKTPGGRDTGTADSDSQAADSSSAPFFLAVEFDEPHGPYICPPPFRDRFGLEDIYAPPTMNADLSGKPRLQQDYARYLRSLKQNPDGLAGYYPKYYSCNSYVDYEIGRVMEAVRASGASGGRDTVVVFTSDHGDHLGAFGLGPKGPTMYDHTIAVPLIAWSPGIGGGRRIPGVVSSVDIWATILDLAGAGRCIGELDRARGYDGRSLVPLLEGSASRVREAAFVEYDRFGIKFEQCDGFYPIRCVRTERWKLAINLFDRDELYDLENDPHEAENLIDREGVSTVRNELHDRLLEWQSETQDLLRSPEWRNRPWREPAPRSFVGLTTTGAHEQWEDWPWTI